jgi:hypothetical protein
MAYTGEVLMGEKLKRTTASNTMNCKHFNKGVRKAFMAFSIRLRWQDTHNIAMYSAELNHENIYGTSVGGTIKSMPL